jgi:hypothetical protein
MMRTNRNAPAAIAALVAMCGTAGTVHAQDSHSVDAGVYDAAGGDALRAHDLQTQCVAYTVDLAPLTTAWGVEWGIGPIAKSSRMEPEFFNTFLSNPGLSLTMLVGQDRSGDAFQDWDPSFGPAGVSPDGNNDVTFFRQGPAVASQLGFGFSEFGGNQNSNVIGGRIAWDPASNPGRLYVERTVAAVNNEANNNSGSADLSFGSVDASGFAYFRADYEQVTGPLGLVGDNLFRIDLPGRDCDKLNWINRDTTNGNSTATNDLPATDFIGSTFVGGFTVPTNMPTTLGQKVLSTTRFAMDEYVHENPANSLNLTVQGHVEPAFVEGPSPENGLRGALQFGDFPWLGGVGVAAQLVKPLDGASYFGAPITNPAGETWAIALTGVSATGAPVAGSQRTLMLPWALNNGTGPVIDPAPGDSGLDPNTGSAFVLPEEAEFDHYRGATVFRGPAAQVALGETLSGLPLVAAVAYHGPLVGERDNPGNAVVVGELASSGNPPAVNWKVAAWTNFDGSLTGVSGKAILDQPGGNVIGRLVPYSIASTNNLRGFNNMSDGPSISVAGFDSAGNLYFTSAIQLIRGAEFDTFSPQSPPPQIPQLPLLDDGTGAIVLPNDERDLFEFGLIRAVRDAQGGHYDLDLVMRTGQVFTSQDAGENGQAFQYMIDRFTIASNNGAGLNPVAFDSGQITNRPMHGGTPVSDPIDARALGGLVVEAQIVYDKDGLDLVTELDGNSGNGFAFDYPLDLGGAGPFENLSAGATMALFPGSGDEAYRVLMFIGNEPSVQEVGACCFDVVCVDNVTEAFCLSSANDPAGEFFLGADCSQNPCAPAFAGVCCFACDPAPVPGACPDASGMVGAVACQDVADLAACEALGGTYRDGLSCADAIDPCQCPADLNGDGNVDVFDFGDLAANFGNGTPDCATRAEGDLNCDGVIDVFDFGDLAADFGCTSN